MVRILQGIRVVDNTTWGDFIWIGFGTKV